MANVKLTNVNAFYTFNKTLLVVLQFHFIAKEMTTMTLMRKHEDGEHKSNY